MTATTSGPLRPHALAVGDAIAVVAPASPPSPRRLRAGMEVLRDWGFRPRLGAHTRDVRGYLAGTDADRAADLRAAFADPTIKAVWGARGGYGAGRIIDRLDLDAIVADPKLFIGFSDLTAVHLALADHARIATVHAPTVAKLADLGNDELAPLLHLLSVPRPLGDVPLHDDRRTLTTMVGGRAEGRLLGGNLTMLAAACGTPTRPRFRGAIALIEEVNEAPYRVDRLLTQLRLSGVFDGVAGIIVAHSPGCDAPDGTPRFEDVIADRLGALGVPLLVGAPLGHGPRTRSVPLGVRVTLDADEPSLHVIEPCTR